MITDVMKKYRNNIKYSVDTLILLFNNGDTEQIEPGMVTHLFIEKDYENLYFPIINIGITMDDELFHRIQNENETVKFRLRINRNIYDINNNFIKYEQYCNDTFICFLNKEVIVKDKEEIKQKQEIERTIATQNTRANVRTFNLFKDDIIKCKTILNISIKEASLTDLILYMLNKIGINRLLMTKLDNLENIDNILIPSGNLIECLTYLNQIKGFYNKGLLLFFDIDTAYFIDKNSKCSCWRKNEIRITHMHVSNEYDYDSQITGLYTDVDRKSTHVFTSNSKLKIINNNLLNDQLQGNNIVIINNKNNNVENIKENTTQIGTSNKLVLESKEDNKYMISELKQNILENECVIQLAFIGVDIDLFSPNKEFLLTFSDSELNKNYGGNYRIIKTISSLNKDGENLYGAIECIFKKQ